MRVNCWRMTAASLPGSCRALLAVIAIAAPFVSSAQNPNKPERIAPFSALYVTTGTMLVDVSKLNERFERNDLPVSQRPGYFTISNDGYSVGAGAYGVFLKRIVVGGEFHAADMGSESSPAGKTNQLTTMYWMATGGYSVFTTWRVSFVPFAGVGMGSANLILKARNDGLSHPLPLNPTFDEIIANPGPKSTIQGTYVMVQPGLAVDYLMLPSDASHVGLVLGLRFTSAISPNRTTWRYGGTGVFGGPDLGPSGGMVRVVVGIGGFRMGKPRDVAPR